MMLKLDRKDRSDGALSTQSREREREGDISICSIYGMEYLSDDKVDDDCQPARVASCLCR